MRNKCIISLLSLIRFSLYAFLTGLCVLLLGFLIFFYSLSKAFVLPMKSADGIIVLTGGTSRIESALQLLREGYASHLLVSGVHEENREQILKFHLREFSDLLDCCVYIDRLARNTFENARESLSWIQKNGYHRLILVTSDYHMPRSLVTFRRIMRSVELIPYSVSSSEVRKMQNIKEWLSFPVMLMIFTEYLKFLFVFLNLCLFFSFC